MGAILQRLLVDKDFQQKFRLLQEQCHETAREKGWWEPPKTFGEQAVLFHSEISEAIEEYRNNRMPNEVYVPNQLQQPAKPEGIPIELADLLIRVFDSAEYYNIDLIGAILMKMQYNETRSRRHGGKVI